MFSEKNLPKLIIISPIIAIVLITSFTSYLFIQTQQKSFKDESIRFERDFIKSKKDSLKNELESIYNYLSHQERIYVSSANEKVIKRTFVLRSRLIQLQKDLQNNINRKEILENLVNSSTSSTNYFFAYDVKNGQIIQAEGKDIKKEFYKDEKFFENYLYSERGKLIPFSKSNKIVYILYLPKLDWIIGNIEDIDADIKFIKKVAINYIATLKFDETGYSWIVKDKNIINENKNIRRYINKIINSEEGLFFKYESENDRTQKLSFSKYFEKWNWVIGASLDLNYVKKTIDDGKVQMKNRIEGYISWVTYISLFIMFILTILSAIISNKISKTFTSYKQNEQEQKKALIDLNNSLSIKVQEGIKEAQKKDRAMLHQSRLARLGSMISMIAHQWRQPLTEVSAILAELETATLFGKSDKKLVLDCIKDSDRLLSYMSHTIDDFRTFFKPDKQKEEFYIIDACNSSISLVCTTLKELDINLNKNFEENFLVVGYPREFSQVILNLLINAKDIFVERNIKNALIDFHIKKIDNQIHIILKDNAGGIEVENIDMIFEPYFSTKNSNKATGMGLYMSKMIIENNMNGKLQVCNIEDGAKFTIIL